MLSLRRVRQAMGPPRHYAAALALVLVAAAIAVIFRRLPHANLSLLFVLVVLVVASRWGLWPAIFTSVLGFFVLNVFFTAPLYTFRVEEDGDVATLVFFLVMAVLTGNLGARMRSERASNRAALDRLSSLLEFSRRMAAAPDEQQALQILVDRLAEVFEAPVVMMLPRDGQRFEQGARNVSRGGPAFDVEEAARAWATSSGAAVHNGAWTYLSLGAATDRIGVVAIGASQTPHEKRQLADALCEQTSIAIERTRLVDELRTAHVVSEKERLRSTLLSSVSHDLRTPLAAIIGSATSVLEYDETIKPNDRRELLQTIRDESERLDRYIQNLLEMTRFGQKDFTLQREWVDLNDLVAAAVKRLGSALAGFTVDIDIEDGASLIFVQGALIEQMLVNLLGNASEFSPPGGRITIAVRAQDDAIVLEVVDEGPGIPAHEREKVFDLFYRAQQGDRGGQGTGLGLAICRSIVAAHGGTIEAADGRRGGTQMRAVLPREERAETGRTSDVQA